jgi:hypothetical protein
MKEAIAVTQLQIQGFKTVPIVCTDRISMLVFKYFPSLRLASKRQGDVSHYTPPRTLTFLRSPAPVFSEPLAGATCK